MPEGQEASILVMLSSMTRVTGFFTFIGKGKTLADLQGCDQHRQRALGCCFLTFPSCSLMIRITSSTCSRVLVSTCRPMEGLRGTDQPVGVRSTLRCTSCMVESLGCSHLNAHHHALLLEVGLRPLHGCCDAPRRRDVVVLPGTGVSPLAGSRALSVQHKGTGSADRLWFSTFVPSSMPVVGQGSGGWILYGDYLWTPPCNSALGRREGQLRGAGVERP